MSEEEYAYWLSLVDSAGVGQLLSDEQMEEYRLSDKELMESVLPELSVVQLGLAYTLRKALPTHPRVQTLDDVLRRLSN